MVDYCIICFQLYHISTIVNFIANLTKAQLTKHFDTVQFIYRYQIVNVYDAARRSLQTSLMNATAHAMLPCSAPSTRYATSRDATSSCSPPNCLSFPVPPRPCPNPQGTYPVSPRPSPNPLGTYPVP